jgi:hypothetical protein
VIVSIFAVALAFGFDKPPSGIWVFAVIVFGLFALSMFFGFKALMIRDWAIGPELRGVQMRVAHEEAYQWLLSGNEMVAVYFENEPRIKAKENGHDSSCSRLPPMRLLCQSLRSFMRFHGADWQTSYVVAR